MNQKSTHSGSRIRKKTLEDLDPTSESGKYASIILEEAKRLETALNEMSNSKTKPNNQIPIYKYKEIFQMIFICRMMILSLKFIDDCGRIVLW